MMENRFLRKFSAVAEILTQEFTFCTVVGWNERQRTPTPAMKFELLWTWACQI